ncbi:MAG: asparagine synthase (glutamine-hydrolyzing) [Elusimicrobia bacterium]|nr:asparagine synthase (glutamine-hydrolyzing) [Elusimicrobiota bacterium]
MCGIAGLVGCGDRETLERMTRIQSYRGPDDSGVWGEELPDGSWWGLGSRRLAIRDLSPAGHMPMADAGGRVRIVYNGEIYNAAALRSELESDGVRFRSSSDTEVLLALYLKEGPRFVERLNGIFAFAIADRREAPRLMLARDHFGVKPLYLARRGRSLAFASEAKALFETPDFHPVVDRAAMRSYLTFLWVPEPGTLWEGVEKLPAGHFALFERGDWKLNRYWDLTFPPDGHRFTGDGASLAAELRERFLATVKSQLISDVPVGAFLSAGLDSSSIVAAMRRATTGPLRTYTITFPKRHLVGENNLDDAAVAARLAARLGAEHHEITVESKVAELLPKLVWHMDDPTADPALIADYLVCREARKSATVLLSGAGGDEVFGGYRKYRAGLAGIAYRRLPALLRRGVLDPLMRCAPVLNGTPFKGYARLIRKWGRSASLEPREQFIQDGTSLDAAQIEALSPGLPGDSSAMHRAAFDRIAHADALSQMLYVDSHTFMPSLNLNYNDKMSMASSVEVRVPFLDRELVQWAAWNIPSSMKIRGSTTKWILREAMRGLLPEEVLRQPKASFGAPVGYWLMGELREMTDDLLSERRLRERGWLNPQAARRMIDEHRRGTHDWALQIWQFLTLELWAQQFMDRSSAKMAAPA